MSKISLNTEKPQPARRRNLPRPKQENAKNSPDSSAEKKDDSLARDLDKIRSANVGDKKETLKELELLQGAATRNVFKSSSRQERKRKELILNFLAIVMFVLLFIMGFYVGYKTKQYDESQKTDASEFPPLNDLFVRINDESWKSESGKLCEITIKEVKDVIMNEWHLLADKPTINQAVSFTNDNKQMSGILVHYAVILSKLHRTPIGSKDKASAEEKILDNLFTAQYSLKTIPNLDHCPERIECASQLWLSLIIEVVESYVNLHNEVKFHQAGLRVCQALMYSQLSSWGKAMMKCLEAVNLIEDMHDDMASKYELYDWACYICLVSIEKFGKSPNREFEARCFAAATNIGSAQDKRSDVDSIKIFKHLFPYKLPEAKNLNLGLP